MESSDPTTASVAQVAVDRQPVMVVDTTSSPAAHLRPVPLDAVQLTDTFWAPRRAVNHDVTLPSQYERIEETGRLFNFRRAAGKEQGPFRGRYFNDSDVYKWLEGVSWSLATNYDPAVDALADRVIAEIADAQQPDGYLNTYFMFEHAAERWTNFDLHEMYCAGHLFQAAVAHYRATGKTNLLSIATRFADHICDTFGPEEQGKRWGNDGHPEIEMALVELYRATGKRRYLDQVQYFIDARGYGRLGRPYDRYGASYSQDHQPFRELDRATGHAVRALYLNSGAADLVAETGEEAVKRALQRMWHNFVTAQAYITGGAGSRYEGEALGRDYELPNERAYTETCAAIASLMWAWRMLAISGDARYADQIETTLYNGILSGVSLKGDTYFYQNPLMDDGTHRRQRWFGTACCPPNIIRLLASLPGYFYSVSDDGVWIHLFAENNAQLQLPDDRQIRLAQHTNYPWSGDITINVDGTGEWSLHLRIPAWCEAGAAITVNGQPAAVTRVPGSYAEIRRTWSAGDSVRVHLPMDVRRVASHPHVIENRGHVALARGPLVYCIEAVDHAGLDIRDLVLAADATLTAAERPDLLDGVVAITGMATLETPEAGWHDRLYRTATPDVAVPQATPVPLTAVPYYAWANREPGRMQVWLRTDA